MPRMSSVRRLYLEAHTLAMSELKRSIDAPSDEARPLNYIFLKYERPYQAFRVFLRPFQVKRPLVQYRSSSVKNASMHRSKGFADSTLKASTSRVSAW